MTSMAKNLAHPHLHQAGNALVCTCSRCSDAGCDEQQCTQMPAPIADRFLCGVGMSGTRRLWAGCWQQLHWVYSTANKASSAQRLA